MEPKECSLSVWFMVFISTTWLLEDTTFLQPKSKWSGHEYTRPAPIQLAVLQ